MRFSRLPFTSNPVHQKVFPLSTTMTVAAAEAATSLMRSGPGFYHSNVKVLLLEWPKKDAY